MRILSLDVGSKTIGVAVSDPMGWTAQGLKTIRRRGQKNDLIELKSLVRQYEVEEVLMGLPLNMNGSEGPQAEKMRAFAKIVEEGIKLPVKLWDERLSTVGAERSLLEADMSRSKRREVIDKMAAVYILQGYLDFKRNQAKGPGEFEE
jgi:putative holliday junction resolvase